MAGVSYALANFVDGGPILDLPVMEGASWSAQLNRADALSCKVDMRDPDSLALDLRSSAAPKKTVMLARNDDNVILAWGLLSSPLAWDEDERTLSLEAGGIWATYFGSTLLAPASALTAPLITLDGDGFQQVNPALDTTLTGWSLGTIGKKLVAQRLAWPGSPTVFDLPADQVGARERSYLFSAMKNVGPALTDLTAVENGPDFAFDAAYSGLGLRYVMRHGSEAQPRIGTDVGVWSLEGDSPITKLKVADSADDIGSASWLTGGKAAGAALISRAVNPAIITAGGYPSLDRIDTSHNDVTVQATLDAYNAENIRAGGQLTRDLSFTVRADATPALGQYRPGDTVTLDVGDSHPYLTKKIPIRITSMSGDEAGLEVKIGCVPLDA